MTSDLVTLVMAIFFLVVGIKSVNNPRRVQEIVVNFFSATSPTLAEHPFLKWVMSSTATVLVRLIGFLCLVNFTMLAYLLTVSQPPAPF